MEGIAPVQSAPQPTKLSIPLASTEVAAVTVFNDRAEVTRLVKLDKRPPGTYDICVEGLTSQIDPDSVRVKAGMGSMTIMEVAFEVHHKLAEPDAHGRADEVRRDLEKIKQRLSEARAALKRLDSRAELLGGYVAGMLLPRREAAPVGAGPAVSAGPAVGGELKQVEALLGFHEKHSVEQDAQRLKLDEEVARLVLEEQVAKEKLAKLEKPAAAKTQRSHDVSVLLTLHEPKGKGEAAPPALLLTYMVRGARWSPSYDLRVDTTSAKGGELSLAYLGLVVNSSGEDWTACRLSLSTAKPSSAGMPPAPPRRMIRWAPPPAPIKRKPGARRGSFERAIPMQAMMSNACAPGGGRRMERQLSFSASEALNFDAEYVEDLDEFVPVETAAVSGGGAGTATFSIERLVSIESDSKPHRVAIAMLSLSPSLNYFATPSLEAAFYLQMKAKNTSSYPLLASDKVSVFLDGSFVTTTKLKDVSPSEEFTTFLGVDPAIKLEHQQLAKENKSGGWTSNTTRSTARFLTKLHNTKAVPVRLTLVEVLPKSSEDKIKVELLTPTAKELSDATSGPSGERVMQNKATNNVVWSVELGAGAKRDISFEYVVSWPSDKHIDTFDAAAEGFEAAHLQHLE